MPRHVPPRPGGPAAAAASGTGAGPTHVLDGTADPPTVPLDLRPPAPEPDPGPAPVPAPAAASRGHAGHGHGHLPAAPAGRRVRLLLAALLVPCALAALGVAVELLAGRGRQK